MAKKKIKIALVYDFDGTLSPANMQEYSFMDSIDVKKDEFWSRNSTLAEVNDADQILTYMYRMMTEARNKDLSLKREQFVSYGESVELFDGVEEWFGRINQYGEERGVIIEHYINSSGLKEIIEGTAIAKEFEQIFACSYLYNTDGVAEWPAVAVNYTTKTQFLFKINKGIKSVYESKAVNKYIPEEDRPIPFSNMIYIGDGDTDIPCMKLVKQKGGHSIAVYKPKTPQGKRRIQHLLTDQRVDYICPANYSEGSDIDILIKAVIDKIVADDKLKKISKKK